MYILVYIGGGNPIPHHREIDGGTWDLPSCSSLNSFLERPLNLFFLFSYVFGEPAVHFK
jgi:hypothetical protein